MRTIVLSLIICFLASCGNHQLFTKRKYTKGIFLSKLETSKKTTKPIMQVYQITIT
jgi:hypothetical protein